MCADTSEMASQEHVLLSTEQYKRLVQRLKECDTVKNENEQLKRPSSISSTESDKGNNTATDTQSATLTRAQENTPQESVQDIPALSGGLRATTSQEQAVGVTEDGGERQRKDHQTTRDNDASTTTTRTKNTKPMTKQMIREKLSPPGKRNAQNPPLAHRRKWSKLE